MNFSLICEKKSLWFLYDVKRLKFLIVNKYIKFWKLSKEYNIKILFYTKKFRKALVWGLFIDLIRGSKTFECDINIVQSKFRKILSIQDHSSFCCIFN